MANKLQSYFPILRSRDEILKIIYREEKLKKMFVEWEQERQEEFLDFCSGARGVKMLYDSFAKELLNPETVPERLNELLSLLLKTEVKIIQILPNDNSRIAEESSLLVMDIVVRLADGSIADVEIQKVGYAFPGQRCACYSADLLLRQYKLVRGKKTKDTFFYQEIKSVYTIVFFEKSPKEFQQYPENYLHCFRQVSDTGLEMELLQKYLFIPLDIFRKKHHNKAIRNRLEAWLTFLGSDDPEDIIQVIERYPDFKAMYEQVYEICQNVERVMEVFSKELREMDRNTVRYMIDEMQSELDRMKEEKVKLQAETDKLQAETDKLQAETDKLQAETDKLQAETDKLQTEKNILQAEKANLIDENTMIKDELRERNEKIELLEKQLEETRLAANIPQKDSLR